MTGSPRPGTPPRSDADWARTVEERMDAVETGPATRVGDWVLSTDPLTGNLIASHVKGGGRRLALVPPPGMDPEAVTGDFPLLRLQRQENLAMSSNHAIMPIPWDTVDILRGPWAIGGSENITTITIPEDGVYRISVSTCYANISGLATRAVYVEVDASVVMYSIIEGIDNTGPDVTDVLTFSGGQEIVISASKGGTTSANLGSSTSFPLIFPTATIERIM